MQKDLLKSVSLHFKYKFFIKCYTSVVGTSPLFLFTLCHVATNNQRATKVTCSGKLCLISDVALHSSISSVVVLIQQLPPSVNMIWLKYGAMTVLPGIGNSFGDPTQEGTERAQS